MTPPGRQCWSTWPVAVVNAVDAAEQAPPMTAQLARQIAVRVGTLDGVVAVALGGSLARGQADRESDIDLGVYHDPSRPFAIDELRELVTQLDDNHTPELVGFGDWGPWINGGVWTHIRGTKVDLLYRDLRLVDRILAECAQGITTCHYQPGHPHGFHTHMYAGEVHHNVALYDPDGRFAARQAQTSPYPANLRRTIVRRYLWEAEFATVTMAGAAVREADRFAASPPGFAAEVTAILRGLHPEPARLRAALARMATLTAAVRGRCGDVLGDR